MPFNPRIAEIGAMSIVPDESTTLSSLFRERIARSPRHIAYRQFDTESEHWHEINWEEMGRQVGCWQQALQGEDLKPGDRVGLILKNCCEWILFDQAALGLGLVTVPLYSEDRADNIAYIVQDAEIKLLLVEGKRQWQALLETEKRLPTVNTIVSLEGLAIEPEDTRVKRLDAWLRGKQGDLQTRSFGQDTLASIVYTSGTTGKPKGVMLTHGNFINNAWSSLRSFTITEQDVFLSFLPLSHTLERTVGYYMSMMAGAQAAFARAVSLLAEDLLVIRPTALISVPRIYERVYGRINAALEKQPRWRRALFNLAVAVGWRRFEYQQGRQAWHPGFILWPLLRFLVGRKILASLGGRMRVAVCGGAPLPPDIAYLFISLGLELLQGYGLTESSPVVSVNRSWDNIPASIGLPLPDIEARVGENDELQTRSASVMQGYWRNQEATQATFTDDGWLKTGDKARIDDSGHIYITGRLKEILVLGNGEKVPPADMEMAISLESLFEQVMVIGEGRRFLAALIVLETVTWQRLAQQLGVVPDSVRSLEDKQVKREVLKLIGERIKSFPGYAQIRDVVLTLEPWTIENDMQTPTLKLKRRNIERHYQQAIEMLYENAKN